MNSHEQAVRVEPLNDASKSDVRVAEHTKVDFAAGELSFKTTKAGEKSGAATPRPTSLNKRRKRRSWDRPAGSG